MTTSQIYWRTDFVRMLLITCCLLLSQHAHADDGAAHANKDKVTIGANKPASNADGNAVKVKAGTRDQVVDFGVGHSQVIESNLRITSVDGFDSGVIQVQALSPTSIRLVGKSSGLTQLRLTDEKAGKTTITVRVPKEHELSLRKLLKQLYPQFTLEWYEVQDSILVRGKIDTAEHQQQIVEILEQYYPHVLVQMKVSERPADSTSRVIPGGMRVVSIRFHDPQSLVRTWLQPGNIVYLKSTTRQHGKLHVRSIGATIQVFAIEAIRQEVTDSVAVSLLVTADVARQINEAQSYGQLILTWLDPQAVLAGKNKLLQVVTAVSRSKEKSSADRVAPVDGLIDPSELRSVRLPIHSTGTELLKKGDRVDIYQSIRKPSEVPYLRLVATNIRLAGERNVSVPYGDVLIHLPFEMGSELLSRSRSIGAYYLRPSTANSLKITVDPAKWSFTSSEIDSLGPQLAAVCVLLKRQDDALPLAYVLAACRQLRVIYPSLKNAIPSNDDDIKDHAHLVDGLATKDQTELSSKVATVLRHMKFDSAAQVVARLSGAPDTDGLDETALSRPAATELNESSDDSELRDEIRALHSDVKRLIQILESKKAKRDQIAPGQQQSRLPVDSPQTRPPRPNQPTNAARLIGKNAQGEPTIDSRDFGQWKTIVELEPSADALIPAVQALCSLGRKNHISEVIEALVEVSQRFLLFSDDGLPGADKLMRTLIAEVRRLDEDASTQELARLMRAGKGRMRTTALMLAMYAYETDSEFNKARPTPSEIRRAMLSFADEPAGQLEKQIMDAMLLSQYQTKDAGNDKEFVNWLWKQHNSRAESSENNSEWRRMQSLNVLLAIQPNDTTVVSKLLTELDAQTKTTKSLNVWTYSQLYATGDSLERHLSELIELLKKTGLHSGRSVTVADSNNIYQEVFSDRICVVDLLSSLGRKGKSAVPIITELLSNTNAENWPKQDEIVQLLPHEISPGNYQLQKTALARFHAQQNQSHSWSTSTNTRGAEPKQFVIACLRALHNLTGQRPEIERLKPQNPFDD